MKGFPVGGRGGPFLPDFSAGLRTGFPGAFSPPSLMLLSPARQGQARVIGSAWHPIWVSTLATQSMSWSLSWTRVAGLIPPSINSELRASIPTIWLKFGSSKR